MAGTGTGTVQLYIVPVARSGDLDEPFAFRSFQNTEACFVLCVSRTKPRRLQVLHAIFVPGVSDPWCPSDLHASLTWRVCADHQRRVGSVRPKMLMASHDQTIPDTSQMHDFLRAERSPFVRMAPSR